MTANEHRVTNVFGLAIDAGLLWNANRLYKKKRSGWGTFFLIWGAGGALYNTLGLMRAKDDAQDSMGDATDLIGQGLTDVTLLAQNQQNLAYQQSLLANQSWLEQKAVAGLPNWALLAGGAAAVYIAVKK
jgi:hypothetical protein